MQLNSNIQELLKTGRVIKDDRNPQLLGAQCRSADPVQVCGTLTRFERNLQYRASLWLSKNHLHGFQMKCYLGADKLRYLYFYDKLTFSLKKRGYLEFRDTVAGRNIIARDLDSDGRLDLIFILRPYQSQLRSDTVAGTYYKEGRDGKWNKRNWNNKNELSEATPLDENNPEHQVFLRALAEIQTAYDQKLIEVGIDKIPTKKPLQKKGLRRG